MQQLLAMFVQGTRCWQQEAQAMWAAKRFPFMSPDDGSKELFSLRGQGLTEQTAIPVLSWVPAACSGTCGIRLAPHTGRPCWLPVRAQNPKRRATIPAIHWLRGWAAKHGSIGAFCLRLAQMPGGTTGHWAMAKSKRKRFCKTGLVGPWIRGTRTVSAVASLAIPQSCRLA